MRGKKLICRIICLGTLLLGAMTVKAEDRVVFEEFTAGADAEDEKLNASVKCAGNGKSMDISFETLELPEDQYSTVTAYKNDNRDIDPKGSIRLGIKNEENQKARMNFSVISEDGGVFQVKEDCYVRLKGTQIKYVPVENGCFEIPSGFEGEAEISFLTMSGGDTGGVLGEEIMGYGFVCVSGGQCKYHLKLRNMYFLDSDDAVDAEETVVLKIDGAQTVRKPETGFSKSLYTVAGYNMQGQKKETEAEFFLNQKSAPGVSMTKDGWIKVLPEAGDSVVIRAKEPNLGLTAELKVELERSWTTLVLTENGYDASIVKPEDVQPIIDKDVWNMQQKALGIIWGLAAGGTGIFFVYYIIVRKRNRRN